MTWLMVGRNEKGVKAGDATMNWLTPFPKRINENVVCASPAASDKPASPSMPMVCAIHVGDSPGLRRGCAVHARCRQGRPELKCYRRKWRAVRALRDPHGTAPGPTPDTRRTLAGDNFETPASVTSLRRHSRYKPGIRSTDERRFSPTSG